MSLTETLFLVVGALVLFGPKKLPEIARQLGKILGELRRASAEFRFQMEEELRVSDEAERRKQPVSEAVAPGRVMLPQPPMPQAPEGEMPVARTNEGFVSDPQPPSAGESEAAADPKPAELPVVSARESEVSHG